MRTLVLYLLVTIIIVGSSTGVKAQDKLIPVRKEYAATLLKLADALLERQLKDSRDVDCGAIACARCKVLHTRAAEAVYPFTIAYTITKKEQYLQAAKSTAAWLFRQQQPDGSWKETPEEWTGTTTDQLLMLLLSYEKLAGGMTNEEKEKWRTAMTKAADYLHKVMTPEFASINYVATTTATLAKAGQMLNNGQYLQKARALAHRTISKMDADGFLNGEGGRSHGNKMGVDLGYNMEMSLWGLGLYARLTNDTVVHRAVAHALKNHLWFIYPDGSLDASWGIRSNKWTVYGSGTSDGSQVLFTLFADEDQRYAAASFRNLQFLRSNILPDGLIGYGPQHATLFKDPPCIYPTFTKAKNIAMAYALETKDSRPSALLPTKQTGWFRYFHTLDVVEVRTRNFMATITGYTYKDLAGGSKSKYMYRPAGGAMSYCWVEGHGMLQASSATEYSRPEPMSFPEAPGVITITPRIEYRDSSGYFTNLFEYDCRLQAGQRPDKNFWVSASGELKDKNWFGGGVGVGYTMDYLFADKYLEKTVHLTWHDAWPVVSIIEPFVQKEGCTIQQVDDKTVMIRTGKRAFRFRLMNGKAKLSTGENAEHYWAPYPSVKAFPLRLEIQPPANSFQGSVTYRIELID